MNNTTATQIGTRCIRGGMSALHGIAGLLDVRLLGVFVISFPRSFGVRKRVMS